AAAGVAIVTGAARLVAELRRPPQRTIRVVLFANEEFGLSGGRAYAQSHAKEIDQHVIAMEADFGAGRVWQLSSSVAPDALGLVAAIHEMVKPLGVEWSGNEGHGGADISPLHARGVPVIDPGQDGSVYFDVHHTDNDTLDKIDPAQLNQNVAVYATAAYVAAMADRTFGRVPVEE